MLNTGASVLRYACWASVDNHSVHATVTMRGCGRLLLHCTAAPVRCTLNGTPLAQFNFSAESSSLALDVAKTASLVSELAMEFSL
jgi:hypothetical protein